jgi:hypothetical protein
MSERLFFSNAEAASERPRAAQAAERLQQEIEEGVTAAQAEHREIDFPTALHIAHALGRATSPDSALAEYGRLGQGQYELLREEYLALYGDASTPPEVRTWIDWFGSHVLQKKHHGTLRRFSNEHLPPTLDRLLVPTRLEIGGEDFTVHVPASHGQAAIDDLRETLEELHLHQDEALQAFLSLPDVSAMSGDIMESFHESYVATFESIEDAAHELLEVDELEKEVQEFAAERHLFIEAVTPDYEAFVERARDGYDLVEWKGRVYAFYQ